MNPRCAVCDAKTAELLRGFGWSGRVFLYDEAAAGEIDEAVPVSYTHLDVYKRQIPMRSVSAPPTR